MRLLHLTAYSSIIDQYRYTIINKLFACNSNSRFHEKMMRLI